MLDSTCFFALTLATLAIASRMVALIHKENDRGTAFQQMRLALHVALALVLAMIFDVGIEPAFAWLRHMLPHDGTPENRTIAAMLTGLGCAVFVLVVPWGMVAAERLRRDVSSARKLTTDLMDRLRAVSSPDQTARGRLNEVVVPVAACASSRHVPGLGDPA